MRRRRAPGALERPAPSSVDPRVAHAAASADRWRRPCSHRNRTPPGTDGDGLGGGGLGEALLPGGGEASEAQGEADQQRRAAQVEGAQQQQLILHRPFQLDGFVRFVGQQWAALLRERPGAPGCRLRPRAPLRCFSARPRPPVALPLTSRHLPAARCAAGAIGSCLRAILGQGRGPLSLLQVRPGARRRALRGSSVAASPKRRAAPSLAPTPLSARSQALLGADRTGRPGSRGDPRRRGRRAAPGALVPTPPCPRRAPRPPRPPPPPPLRQASRLEELQARVGVPYDPSNALHQEALRELWDLAFPGGAGACVRACVRVCVCVYVCVCV
jgi:hypothetical protein